MTRFSRLPARFGWLVLGCAFSISPSALAQSTGAFPDPAPPPAPAPAPAPAPTTPPPAVAPVAPVAPAPASTAAAPPPAPAPAPTQAPPPPPVYEPPPPPPVPPEEKKGFPPFSARIDPFLLILDGKLAVELEVAVLKFMSIELVPVFIVNKEPPTFNFFTGREDPLSRESDGLGPLAGTSLDVGFWFGKKPLEGSVLRVIFTNYAYHYHSVDEIGEFDDVPMVERRLFAYFGSHSKYGAFTLAGGFGIGYELNLEKRCFVNDPPAYTPKVQGCPDGELLIKTDRLMRYEPLDLNGGLDGFQFLFRFSLGVAFN